MQGIPVVVEALSRLLGDRGTRWVKCTERLRRRGLHGQDSARLHKVALSRSRDARYRWAHSTGSALQTHMSQSPYRCRFLLPARCESPSRRRGPFHARIGSVGACITGRSEVGRQLATSGLAAIRREPAILVPLSGSAHCPVTTIATSVVDDFIAYCDIEGTDGVTPNLK